MTFVEAEHIIV